jgi:KH domain
MHTLVCGRTRKNIKLIESATKTAIYFPPPFPRVFGYVPSGATRRSDDEVFITGETQERIRQAKQKLRDLVTGVKIYVKDVMVNSNKIDNILLDRLDKVRKVMETNGSYVLFPQLGSQRGMVRVQGTEVLHVERTVREIMALVRHSHFRGGSNADAPLPGWTILQRVLVGHSSEQSTRRTASGSFCR